MEHNEPKPPDTPQTGQDAPGAPAAPQTGQDAAQDPVLLDELQRLRQQVAQSDAREQAAVAAALAQSQGAQAGPRVSVDLSELDQAERGERYKDWPERGGSELPQPWDLTAQGLHGQLRDFERDSQPGSPNTVSPIVIAHGKPILANGSSDPTVHELGRILGQLGFPNSVSDGQNPYGAVDNSVMAAVYSFRDAYGVQEDPSGWGGNTPDGRARAAAHIGPWTWEAILRAGEHASQPA